MATDDAVKQLEARLTRLEAALAQSPGGTGTGGFTPPGGAVVDPAPWFQGGFGGLGQFRFPHPIVDPATFAWSRQHWPTPVVDPAPWPTPVVDPAVFAGAMQTRAAAAAALGRIGTTGGDPPPPDVSRFSIAQLEATLHSINAEKARLASMETMVSQQLDKLKKQGPQT